jgi:hypothetical protein
MTVQTAMGDLHSAVRDLRGAAEELRRTICEYAPDEGRTMHVDELCEWAGDLDGAAATMALEFQALDGGLADRTTAEALATAVGARHLDFEEQYEDRVAGPRHAAEMRRLALGPGREWRGWCKAAGEAIGDCRAPLAALRRALHECWRELAQQPEVRLERATIAQLHVAEKQDV